MRGGKAIAVISLPAAQLARFAASGGAVAAVYVSLTVLLLAIETPAQVALAMGYVAGLLLHFTLNRRFVFASAGGFAHRLSAQGARYLLVAVAAYAATAAAMATLPGWLDAPEVAVFISVTGLVTVVNFVVLRSWVFRSAGEED
jgi:putative flippase GtrA